MCMHVDLFKEPTGHSNSGDHTKNNANISKIVVENTEN